MTAFLPGALVVEGLQRGFVVRQLVRAMEGLDNAGEEVARAWGVRLRSALVEKQLSIREAWCPFMGQHQRQRGLANAAHAAQTGEHGAGGIHGTELHEVSLASEKPNGQGGSW